MKKIKIYTLALFILLASGSITQVDAVTASSSLDILTAKTLNVSISPTLTASGEMPAISWDNIGADYYMVSVSCSSNISTSRKAGSNICTTAAKIYPTSGSRVTLDNIVFSNTGYVDTNVTLEITPYYNDKLVLRSYTGLTILPVHSRTRSSSLEAFQARQADSSTVSKTLELSINPKKVESGEAPEIKWNNVGADYYTISATCKDRISESGSRSRVCNTSKKIDGTRNARLNVDNVAFTNTATTSNTVLIELAAYGSDDRAFLKTYTYVEVEPSDNENTEDAVTKPETSDKEDIGVVREEISSERKLKIVSDMFGENSDIYRLVFLLIQLGII